jgi:hypothetical protein
MKGIVSFSGTGRAILLGETILTLCLYDDSDCLVIHSATDLLFNFVKQRVRKLK